MCFSEAVGLSRKPSEAPRTGTLALRSARIPPREQLIVNGLSVPRSDSGRPPYSKPAAGVTAEYGAWPTLSIGTSTFHGLGNSVSNQWISEKGRRSPESRISMGHTSTYYIWNCTTPGQGPLHPRQKKTAFQPVGALHPIIKGAIFKADYWNRYPCRRFWPSNQTDGSKAPLPGLAAFTSGDYVVNKQNR